MKLSEMTDSEKTKYITDTLGDRHNPLEEAYFVEVRVGNGKAKENLQRLDAWAIRYGKDNRTTAYEIKSSRGDFLNETKKPLKKRRGMMLSNEFYYVCYKGTAHIHEIPEGCGLITVDDDGKFQIEVPAIYRDIPPLPRNFISVILRRLDKERLYHFLKNMDQNEWIQETGNIVLQVLVDHINKWANHAQGDKTLPDKVAAALRDVRQDVIQEMINKRVMR